jgi:uncharacterized membrane protein YphA (DoxX/SURF4 family)
VAVIAKNPTPSVNLEVFAMNSIKRHLPTASRLLLGLIFLVNGLNGFLQFLPMPAMPGDAMAFAGALMKTGYFFPLFKTIEITAGALLLAGVAVPFALTLLAPIIVNIAAFHLFLAPAALPMVAVLLAIELHLAWTHRAAFAPLFARKLPTTVRPAVRAVEDQHAAAA